MRISRGTAGDVKSHDKLASCSDCGPDPDAFGILFHFSHQFIQLQMSYRQCPVKQSLMQPFAMATTSFDPAGKGGMVMAKDTPGC